jgi:putative membrane protein
VEKAALGNMTEIKFGELASTKATDPLVKDFAMRMVQDHTGAQAELKDISNDYSDVDWPNDMDQQHKDLFADLNNRSGYSFDSLYMSSQIVDHQMTIATFETEISSGTVDRVKTYANKYLPHIEMHFQQADSIKNVIIASHNADDLD